MDPTDAPANLFEGFFEFSLEDKVVIGVAWGKYRRCIIPCVLGPVEFIRIQKNLPVVVIEPSIESMQHRFMLVARLT